jgi:hypothetical protein
MAEASGKRSNGALWLGLLLTVLGVLSNGLYYVGFPAAAVVWISLILPAVGFVVLLVGVLRAFRESNINVGKYGGKYGGKVWGSIAALVSVLVLAASAGLFVVARRLPQPSGGTPQVGQRVPDFSLPDSDGQPVTLSQMLSGSPGSGPPRAVLLVFYRGYW